MNFPVYIMATRNLGMNLIRGIFVTLDIMVFQVFQWVTQAVFDLTTLEIVKEEAYQAFQERIYVILGIFMLFKIAISLLNYLVSPDKISDKEQGMGKLFMRVIISLCMLVAAPSFFNFLSRVQGPLLNAVPRIILGTATSVESTTNSMGTMASDIAWTTYGVVLDQENLDGSDLIQGWDDLPAKINDPGEDNSVYKYTYRPVLGILIGAVMSFLMLAICLDIAIRVFKLAILRMIAPIPILSYIDPKSSKDGMFQNYMKTLMSTWLDVFIKIGVLFFVISMIEIVILEGNASLPINNLPGIRGLVASIFIIIGLLFFARQFPQFVSSALGIKNSKGLGIGLGGALAAGGALVGGAGLAGMIKASGDYMNDAADSAAQGKAAGPTWGRGRDVAAQLRTGDSNAKARNLGQTINDQLMRANAAMHGITESSLDSAKQSMYNAKDRAADANAMRERFMQNGRLSEEDKRRLSSWGVSNEDIKKWNQTSMDKFVN
ncbi:MAG: hypothetical protein PUB18_06110, partial [bacterium]|nr:hypothetical protein [bacterium]